MILRQMRDLWTVYRVQGQGVRLDLKGALLRPAAPLYHATARSLPGFGVWSGRVLTVVARERHRSGFVQARWRTGAPVLDLLFIAPSLDTGHGAAWLWQRLLHDLVQVGGTHGVQRLFAHLPEHRHAEVEVMRQAGFAIYARDYLYRLDRLPERAEAPPGLWEGREPIDEWGLTRLYNTVTPPVVQQAESLFYDTSGTLGWWGGARRGYYVLRGNSAGEVFGHLRLTRGEHGHWLKLVLHPERVHYGAQLLEAAVGLMSGWPRRPIYCDVRDYEGLFTGVLEQYGFKRVMTRMLLVRHTRSAVRVRARRLAQALEAAPETAPTMFC